MTITREETAYEFGNRLRNALDSEGVSQNELAAMIDTDPSTISNWMNGKAKPNYYLLKRTAQGLGVSSDYLLGLAEGEEK